MIITEEDGILRIEHRGTKIKDSIDFWHKIDTLYEEGWRFSDPINIVHSPTFFPVVMVEFEKKESNILQDLNKEIKVLKFEVERLTDEVEAYEEPVKEPIEELTGGSTEELTEPEVISEIEELPPLEELEELTKKDPLLDFAERQGIPIPPEKVVASAIKKYIKENLKDNLKA